MMDASVSSQVLFALAAIPGLILIIYSYHLDNRNDKEPFFLLLLLFFCGMLSTISALILEEAEFFVLDSLFYSSSLIYLLLSNFGVGLIEEGGKYFFLKKVTWKNREFNWMFDGVIYSVCISLGFAVLENVEYVFQYGLETALIRAVTAIPAHFVFSVYMGIYYSRAKYKSVYGDEKTSKQLRRKAYLSAALIHGLYDFLAGYSTWIGFFIFLGLIIWMNVSAFRKIRRQNKEDHPFFEGWQMFESWKN